MIGFQPLLFNPWQLGSLFLLTSHAPIQRQRLGPRHEPHLLHLQLLSHPPHFSPFPHRPLSRLLCRAPSSAASHTPLVAAQLSFAWWQSPPRALRAMGPTTWRQSKGLQRVPSLFFHPMPPFSFPCFLRLQLHSRNSVEFGYFIQNNKNSCGHQVGTGRELIWLQREIQCSHENARMGVYFCTLAKFAVSIPPYLIHAPTQRSALACLAPSAPLWDAHPDWGPDRNEMLEYFWVSALWCLLELFETVRTLKTNSWNICNALLSCSNADTRKDVCATPHPWARLGVHYLQLKCLTCLHIKTGTTYQ